MVGPIIPKIGILAILDTHIFLCRPLIEVRIKAKLQALSRNFQQYMAQLLHIGNLRQFPTFSCWESNSHFDPQLVFSHNLCCKYLNGSCEPILDIYVLRVFEWYEEVLNSMSFDLSSHFLKFGSPSRRQLPFTEFKFHSFTFSHTLESVNVTPKLHSRLAFFYALALVVNPRLGS